MKFTAQAIAFPDADDFMIHEVAADGTYQADHLARALALTPQRRLALDGGAHVGLWTRMLSREFTRVLAVEPSADTHEALLWNLAQWQCENVTTYQVALGRKSGTVSMTLDSKQAARRNTGGRHVGPGADVQRITIDALKLDTLDFLKLDIEGAELQALQGATETLSRCRPVVLVEDKGLGERYFQQPRRALQFFLANSGYVHRETIGCDEIWSHHRAGPG